MHFLFCAGILLHCIWHLVTMCTESKAHFLFHKHNDGANIFIVNSSKLDCLYSNALGSAKLTRVKEMLPYLGRRKMNNELGFHFTTSGVSIKINSLHSQQKKLHVRVMGDK